MHYMTLVGNSSDPVEITRYIEKMCSELLTAEYLQIWHVGEDGLFSDTCDKKSRILISKKQGLIAQAYQDDVSGIYNLLGDNKLYTQESDNPQSRPFKDMLLFPIHDENEHIIAIVQACTDINDLHQFTQSDLNVIESVSIFLAKVLVSMENDSLEKGNRKEEKFVQQSEQIVKKLQKELDIAEKKVEIRTQFLAEIAHEIRTPMHAMMGFVELLKDEEKDERKYQYLDYAYKSAEAMTLLLNDTLDFTKVDKGEMQLEEKESSLMAEIYSMISMFYMKTKLSGLDFFSFIDPLIPSKIILDTLRIRQILSNLLSNAIKFTPKGGKVFLEVIYNEAEESLSFFVKDSGIGIAKENQDKIFSAYTQEKESTAREYGGTGLGLSISLQLVQLFGAQLKLESTVDKGSCFFFTIDVKGKVIDKDSELNIKKLQEHKPLLLLRNEESHIKDEIKRAYLRLGLDKTSILHVQNLKDVDVNEYSHIYTSETLLNDKKIQKFLDLDKQVLITQAQNTDYKKLKGKVRQMEGVVFAYRSKNIESILDKNDDKIINDRTILTVDDNPINLDLMTSILKKMGAKVITANDGADALKVYKKSVSSDQVIDLIFMDQNMPNMNGTEAATAIKAYEKEKNIRPTTIIGLCGSQSDLEKDKFEEVGMLDCLCKPVCIDKIRETVTRFLEVS